VTTETALPSATPAAASEANTAEALQQAQTALAAAEGAEAKPEGETTPEGEQPPKKEKTAEEREIAKLRRRLDNVTRQKYELQARLSTGQRSESVTNGQQGAGTMPPQQQTEDEPLTLTRKQLQELVDQRARQVAPTIQQQEAVAEHRQAVITKLAKEFGGRFDEVAADLDDAVGGLRDAQGRPKPVGEVIFEADDPRALIEYLADPENAEEAEALGRMSATQAARTVVKIEAKLAAKKAEAKPQPSKAAPPIEPVRGGGKVNGMPDPADTKAYIKWANEQERAAR
jgi:hypothetical protein